MYVCVCARVRVWLQAWMYVGYHMPLLRIQLLELSGSSSYSGFSVEFLARLVWLWLRSRLCPFLYFGIMGFGCGVWLRILWPVHTRKEAG